jgi:hypothetical protein
MSKVRGDSSVTRNFGTRNQSISPTIQTVANSTLTLDLFSTGIYIFAGNTAGQKVNMGDALTYLALGHFFIFINRSLTTISIRSFSNNEIYSLKKNDCVLAILQGNGSQNGSWQFVPFAVESAASPPFILGRSGSSPANTWLLNESVPTNVVGIPIFLDGGVLTRVSVNNELTTTYSVEIYEHDGTTFTLLHTISVTSAKSATSTDLAVNVTFGKQLAAKVSSGTPKNVKVALSLRGTSS